MFAGYFDVVVITGALSIGHVPVQVVRELCTSAKSGALFSYLTYSCAWKSYFLTRSTFGFPTGGYICMTTRGNSDNLEYKAALEGELKQMEREGLWTCVEAAQVDEWERAVSENEHGYISGVVYLYQKL